MEVVGVKILIRRGGGEEEIEKLENKQLKGSFALSIQKENDILAECFVSGALSRKDLHDFVRQRRTRGGGLIWAWVVSRAHVLLVQDQLNR